MKPLYRSLLMRANRLLGAQLVEHNLINIDDLEAANEKTTGDHQLGVVSAANGTGDIGLRFEGTDRR
ncbi:MAG: hypothetical protein J6386_12545 [Candidatus Synoicihabitans palmerolidicus]|nr:hypothetical protein [Candidatus Synoicihabitans palmerolidicus]